MAGRFADANANLTAHNKTLKGSLWAAFAIIALLVFGMIKVSGAITVHVPPDLRTGATLKPGEVPPANVYAFTYYIFQQLNRWETNGEKDYPTQIFKLSAFMTPGFRASVEKDMKEKSRHGELIGRSRSMQEVMGGGYEPRRVEVLGDDVWLIWLDLHLEETVQGMKVKDTNIRYPLRVVRYNVDGEKNPWGLAIDGLASKTERIAESSAEAGVTEKTLLPDDAGKRQDDGKAGKPLGKHKAEFSK